MTYKYALEKHDISRIDKLNKLTNANTFWEDVRKLCRGVASDHAIGRWQCLAENRYKELTGDMEED
jgi:hypothetical protein